MTETFGASFKIDINNLKAGLTTANKLIRESQSQFKAAAAGLDSFSDAQKISEQKIKSLNEIIPIQEQKVKALKDQYKKLVDDGLDETSDRAIYLRTQINKETESLEKNRKELKDLENSSEDAGDELENLGNEADNTSGKFTVMKGALASLVADGFRMAIQAAKDFAKEMLNVGMTFDDSMAKVAAVSGATETELEALRAKAKEMGSTTKFTASEAADAFNYMAMAGWKTEDMLGGIEGILNLAAASGSDLATTSDIVTDALTAMGYEAKDAGRLADVMAAASSNANTNVEMMGQTFQYAAPIVGALGYSMEDTAVAIGLMANAGIKGEKSGTALRSILTRLSAPPKECADAMTALGISITKTDGTMKSLDEIMIDMRQAFADLSETEQTANAKAIAGQEAMSGLLAIVNAAPADFDKLTQAVAKSDGAAQKMSDTMLNTLGGDMTVLKSQIEGVRLEIYEQLEPTLRGFVQEAQKAIKKINWKRVGTEAKNILKKLSDTAKSFAKNVLPTLKTALGVVGKALKFVIDNFDWLSKVVLIAVTAFKAFKAVMAVTTAITAVKTAISGLSAGIGVVTKAQTGWNAAMAANPIGAVVTAVALLATGIGILASKMKDALDPTNSLTDSQRKLKEQADEVKETMNETTEAYKNLQEEKQKQIGAKEGEFRYYKDLWDELQGIVDQNGKVKEGYEKRASFIADQLSEATGIEIGLVDGIISKYEELGTTIEDTMKKKKAEIYLASQEELYQAAIQNIDAETAAYKENFDKYQETLAEIADVNAQLEAEYEKYNNLSPIGQFFYSFFSSEGDLKNQRKKLEETAQTFKEAYETSAQLVEDYTYNIGIYEHNMALAHEGNFDDMIKTNAEYTREYGGTVEAEKALLEQSVYNTRTQLKIMRDARNEENAHIYDDQIASYEKLLVEQVHQLQAYNSTTENMLGENSEIWRKGLSDNLTAITGMNLEFQDVGQGFVQMVADGEKIGAPLAINEVNTLVNSMLEEIESGKSDAETAGKNLIEGVNSGIKNQEKQNSAFSSIRIFGLNLLSSFQKVLGEHSPSKATRKMGQYLIDGLNLGIKDQEKSTIRQVSRFGANVLSTFQDQVSGLNTDFGGMIGAVGSEIEGYGNKSVTVNQYNTYSQAHSRYELYKTKQQTAAAVRLALGTV